MACTLDLKGHETEADTVEVETRAHFLCNGGICGQVTLPTTRIVAEPDSSRPFRPYLILVSRRHAQKQDSACDAYQRHHSRDTM
nr:hypothetical protein CFP56_24490 [Quercus suber]